MGLGLGLRGRYRGDYRFWLGLPAREIRKPAGSWPPHPTADLLPAAAVPNTQVVIQVWLGCTKQLSDPVPLRESKFSDLPQPWHLTFAHTSYPDRSNVGIFQTQANP